MADMAARAVTPTIRAIGTRNRTNNVHVPPDAGHITSRVDDLTKT
jgi:hypothetical protein